MSGPINLNRVCALCISMSFGVPLFLVSPQSASADVLILKDETLINGYIDRFEDGRLYMHTTDGLQDYATDQIQSFLVQREAEQLYRDLLSRIQTEENTQQNTTAQLAEVLGILRDLSRRVAGVEIQQQVQTDQLATRTQETTPWEGLMIQGARQIKEKGQDVITGMVINRSQTPLASVAVQLTVYGKTGLLKRGPKTVTVNVTPGSLPPGGTGEFRYAFDKRYDVDRFEVAPLGSHQEMYRYHPGGGPQIQY